ncbi:MAG TPA: hypothetical protein VMP00_01280 [Burkholderiales bacterium]|nr:hypothetical protein [Burkholderiales bacterium]
MQKFSGFLVAVATCLLPAGVSGVERAGEIEAGTHSTPWPMQVSGTDNSFVVYPPQFYSWEGNRLQGRAAVSVQAQDSEQPGFGMLTLSARTAVDAASGMVTIGGITIDDAEFPASSKRATDYAALLQRQLGAQSWQVAQERLQSDIAIDRAARQANAQALRHDAPHIIHTQRPAILIPVDGTPVLREVPDTALMRVINTRALILLDRSTQQHFLYASGNWMNARNLEGPWTPAARISPELEQAKELIAQQNQVDLLEDEELLGSGDVPAIYVSTTPAELLQTDGAPEYSPVADTRLLYVINSPQIILFDLESQQHYALISGRWFRSPRLDLPGWTHVPATQLPADFAMIPGDHPLAGTRAAVAGTPEAREAVIANAVPEVAGIDRATASLEVPYDGPASFRPIEGTALQYAVNSPTPVIRASENAFFALDNGVWFVAGSPYGAWTVATLIPPEIYAIPRSSPLHYVTYVRIYGDTPDTVYVGYTPGYVGSYVADSNVVVYGTGWAYRPWIGSVWYGAPVTWGHGFTVIYSWWNPWWSWTPVYWSYAPHYRPWWGPWHVPFAYSRRVVIGAPRSLTVINSVNITNIYQRWSPGTVAWKGSQLHRPKRASAPLTHARPGTGSIRFSDGSVHQFSGSGDPRPRGAGNRARERANLPQIQSTSPRARADSSTSRVQPGSAARRHQADRVQRTEPHTRQQRALPEQALTTPRPSTAPQARSNRRDDATRIQRTGPGTSDRRREALPAVSARAQPTPSLDARPPQQTAPARRQSPTEALPQTRERNRAQRPQMPQQAVPAAPTTAAPSQRVTPAPSAATPRRTPQQTGQPLQRAERVRTQPPAGTPQGRRQGGGGAVRAPIGGLSR